MIIYFLPSVLQLIRELGNINVKKKEPPFCYPYSVKAKVLVLSHLDRLFVSEDLEEGRTRDDDLVQNRDGSKGQIFLLKSPPTVCDFCLFQIRGLC